MLDVFEGFFNFKAIVVYLDDSLPGFSEIIGQNVPRLRSFTALGATDYAER